MPSDHPSRRQLLTGLPAACRRIRPDPRERIEAEHPHDPFGPVPMGLHRRNGRQSHEPHAQSRPDGAARRALPLGLLQSAGMRSGPRLHSHRPVPQPSRRVANAISSMRMPPPLPRRCAAPAIRPTTSASGIWREQVTAARKGRSRQTRAARRIPGPLGGLQHARVDLPRIRRRPLRPRR